jgi:hypothetical protein
MARNLRAILPEDQDTMRLYARRLAVEPRPDVRLMLQLQFVHDMSPRYGHERATRMLSKVWSFAKGWEK